MRLPSSLRNRHRSALSIPGGQAFSPQVYSRCPINCSAEYRYSDDLGGGELHAGSTATADAAGVHVNDKQEVSGFPRMMESRNLHTKIALAGVIEGLLSRL
jgi:hypothetical protein